MGYSWNKDMSIDDQWQSWQDNTDLSKIPDIDTDTLKDTIIKENRTDGKEKVSSLDQFLEDDEIDR